MTVTTVNLPEKWRTDLYASSSRISCRKRTVQVLSKEREINQKEKKRSKKHEQTKNSLKIFSPSFTMRCEKKVGE
jgi:hypothetical protein